MAQRNNNGQRVADFGKQKVLPMGGSEMNKFLEMGLTTLKDWTPTRKNSKYPDTADGFFKFQRRTETYMEYITEANSDPDGEHIIPDIEGWTVYLGIARPTLYSFKKRSEKWKEYIEFVAEIIGGAKKQLALMGKIPPVISMFDLINNHGYHNTSEFHMTTVVQDDKPKLTQEELIAKARALPGMSEETSLIEEHEPFMNLPETEDDTEVIDIVEGEYKELDDECSGR